jgi:oligopeptide/dipeptide ABC transporter ATP-binding protein
MSTQPSPALLEVRNLRTYFRTAAGIARAVDGVSFSIEKGETLALVGESGCGKSMTALSIMQLVPMPPGYIEAGEVRFAGQDLFDLSPDDVRLIRGSQIGMIFQEPLTSLNPVLTVGKQVLEALALHQPGPVAEMRRRAVDALRRVGLPDPDQHMSSYPFELSGGQRQRVMIAMVLACGPALLIADEPTTALDVTIQAQILRLLKKLQQEEGMALLLITHDLGMVSQMADRVAVMYAGTIVEQATRQDLLRNPQHPYTRGLLDSLPGRARRGERLLAIPGMVPRATDWPTGCRFRTRCKDAFAPCSIDQPATMATGPARSCRCYLYGSMGEHGPVSTDSSVSVPQSIESLTRDDRP